MEKDHSNALIAAEAKYKSNNSTINTNVQRDVIQAAEREKELENMVILLFWGKYNNFKTFLKLYIFFILFYFTSIFLLVFFFFLISLLKPKEIKKKH